MFYINYEECKWIKVQEVKKIKLCFILTMRNVNIFNNPIFSNLSFGFILTMRNVNSSEILP